MPADTPTIEPVRITAGDSAAWVRTFADYPASAGWVLTYTLINAQGKQTVAAAADGDAHRVTLAAAGTASWVPGVYAWTAAVAMGSDRHTVAAGQIEVLPNFAAAAQLDTRTPARKALDAADALMATYGAKAYVHAYNIDGRGQTFHKPADFLAWRSTLQAEVRREEAAAGIAAGRRPRNMVYVRFNTR